MSDLYELTVEWPSSTAKSVIVTGDFDQWSKSLPLTRSPAGTFTGSFKVPYGSPTRYKFIVNGEWAYRQDLPTERTREGYVNNVYYVPLKDFLGTPDKPQNGTAGQFISDLADTIAARTGTSSALGYVASGLGKTIQTVVGVDPVNSSQIAIPTPISAHPSSELPSPSANTVNPTPTAPPTNGDATINPESEHTNGDPGKPDPVASDSQQQSGPTMAPIVPISIVPVYAKENCTIDPTKITTDERSTPAVFVGLPSTTSQQNDDESKAKDEVEETEKKEIILPTVPVVPSLTLPTPLEKPAAAAATGASQEVTKVETTEEEPAKPTPTVPATVVTPAAAEEKAPTPTSEEVPKAPEPTQKVEPESIPPPEKPADGTTTAASDSKGLEQAKSMSEGSTTVKSSSRPTTPTGPTASVPSTPASTVNKKSKVFPTLGKGSPSSKENGTRSVDELGVSKGNGSTLGKKKRHSSFFGKLKHIFHHHDHEKEEKKEKGVH